MGSPIWMRSWLSTGYFSVLCVKAQTSNKLRRIQFIPPLMPHKFSATLSLLTFETHQKFLHVILLVLLSAND
jgi:hypothetical protein